MKVYGPYMTYSRSKPRRFVIVHYDDGSKESMSHARWLWENAIGGKLSPEWEVDHIDENPLNDDWSNLRLLPVSVNRSISHKPAETITFNCPHCGKSATKLARAVRHAKKQGKAGPYCSKQCAGRVHN